MKKITEHGDDWLMSEIARLKRLASNKHNSSHKLVELRARLNILREFQNIDGEDLDLTRAMHTARTYEFAKLYQNSL